MTKGENMTFANKIAASAGAAGLALFAALRQSSSNEMPTTRLILPPDLHPNPPSQPPTS